MKDEPILVPPHIFNFYKPPIGSQWWYESVALNVHGVKDVRSEVVRDNFNIVEGIDIIFTPLNYEDANKIKEEIEYLFNHNPEYIIFAPIKVRVFIEGINEKLIEGSL